MIMANLFTFNLFAFGCFLLGSEGVPHNHVRLLVDNPSDLSTYLGYQDHHNHDMSSLVNEASVRAHGTGSSESKPLSFAGTNLWRCDAHVVEVCDLNCLDVDPKDGCPFCVQSCQTTLHGHGTQSSSGQSAGQHGSLSSNSGTIGSSSSAETGTQNSISQSGSPFQQPSSGAGGQTSVSQSGSTFQQPSSAAGAGTGNNIGNGQSGTGSQLPSGPSGIATQTGSSQSGSVAQLPSGLTGTRSGTGHSGQQLSGLTGTGAQSGSSLTGTAGQQSSVLTGTGSQSAGQGLTGSAGSQTKRCPYYPPNCPAVYTKLQNGCLICTILQQAGIATNAPSTVAGSTTTKHHQTCPPRRCVAPCNLGIVIGSDGCPHCKCPDHV